MTLWIAESGGTKTDWIILAHHRPPIHFQSEGLNPNIVGWHGVKTVWAQICQNHAPDACKTFYFFGAGLGSTESQQRMKAQLTPSLPVDTDIHVHSDLVAAGIACSGHKPGLTGILGTGSIAFRFDGSQVTQRSGGLGYLLGDPGSACALGQAFLRGLIAQTWDPQLVSMHHTYFGKHAHVWQKDLYAASSPVPSFRQQIPFLSHQRNHPQIRHPLNRQFTSFFQETLEPLNPAPKETIVLCGGIAREFETTIQSCAQQHDLSVLIHKKAPVVALATYLGQTHDLQTTGLTEIH